MKEREKEISIIKKFIETVKLPNNLEDFTVNDMKLAMIVKGNCDEIDSCQECPLPKVANGICRETTIKISIKLIKLLNNQPETKEEVEQKTKDYTPYKLTREFMKQRGYDHCYMCGGSLIE